MTLYDFELHLRQAKVAKARGKFKAGQIESLHFAKEVWVARTVIGAYKVHAHLTGWQVDYCTCTCDERSKTGFCEHSIMVLFALRKELDVPRCLPRTMRKLITPELELVQELKKLRDDEMMIDDGDISDFISTCKKKLTGINKLIEKQEYVLAAATALGVNTALHELIQYMNDDYETVYKLLDKTMDWVEKIYTLSSPELQDDLYGDVRIETMRRYDNNVPTKRKWLEVLLTLSDTAARQKELLDTIDSLSHLRAIIQQEAVLDEYRQALLNFKAKAITVFGSTK